MADLDDAMPSVDGRVGFRDIYRAVGESEARIVAALNTAVTPLAAGQADHESRLRMLESSVTPLAVAAAERERRLTAAELQIDVNSKIVNDFLARERGVFATLGFGKSLILIAMGIMGTAVAVAGFLSTVFDK